MRLYDKPYKKYAGKHYLVLVTVDQLSEIEPFRIDRSDYGNMDDLFPVGNINTVKMI